jgi:hypothetical protein
VEGRVQGHPGPARRPPVRLSVVVAAVVAAAFVASAIVGAVEVLPRVEDGISGGSQLTSAERRHAAGNRLGLDPAPFDAFGRKLRKRERYTVDVPEGSRGPFITRGAVVRAYSAFFFLPAIQAPEAARIFRYRFR